jgi:hypothetical protein
MMKTSVDDKDVSQNPTVSEQRRKTTNLFKGTEYGIVTTSEGRSKLIQPTH